MKYVKIRYKSAIDFYWCAISDEDAGDREHWDYIFDTVNSSVFTEHEYEGPFDALPDGMAKPDWEVSDD